MPTYAERCLLMTINKLSKEKFLQRSTIPRTEGEMLIKQSQKKKSRKLIRDSIIAFGGWGRGQVTFPPALTDILRDQGHHNVIGIFPVSTEREGRVHS